MWPDLFGPGWIWGILLSTVLLAGVYTWVFLLPRPSDEPADPLLRAWREYEEGGLTRQEFERIRRAWAKSGELLPATLACLSAAASWSTGSTDATGPSGRRRERVIGSSLQYRSSS